MQTKHPHTGKIGKTSPAYASFYYLTGKAAPTPRVVMNIWSGERFGGKPLTIGGTVADLTVPITFEQLWEAWQVHGSQGLWLMAPEILGAGVYIEGERGGLPSIPKLKSLPKAPLASQF
jgi:hypothetical protein